MILICITSVTTDFDMASASAGLEDVTSSSDDLMDEQSSPIAVPPSNTVVCLSFFTNIHC